MDVTLIEKQTVPTELRSEGVRSVEDIWRHEPSEVRNRPLSNLGLFSKLYSHFADTEMQRTTFLSAQGHEFFVMAQKQGTPSV